MKPRILILDIETTPNLGYTWERYEQNVLSVVKHWELLSYAYRWFGEKRAIVCNSRRRYSEIELMRQLWRLFDSADFIVAHNGDAFDIRKVRAKFLQYGLTPPSPSQGIDTLKLARKYFKLSSYKLDDLCQYLGIGKKVKHEGFSLWEKCMSGDTQALKTMELYNKHDVRLEELLYKRLRQWIYRQPALDVSPVALSCPNCGSEHTHKAGYKVLRSGQRKHKMQCQQCFGWFLATVKEAGQ